MTDYGPGHGSPPWHPEPWHPDDPLFGDQWDTGQHQTAGWDPYTQDGQYHTGQYPQVQPDQQYSTQQFPQQQQYPQQQYPPQQPYPGQQQFPQQPQAPQAWETGQLPVQDYAGQTYGWDVQAPYADPAYGNPGYGDGGYGNADYVPPAADPYGGQQSGYYDQNGYPQQQAQARPAPPAQRQPPAPGQTGEWNPFDDVGDEPETHPFFTRGSDADDSDEEYERRRPRDDDDDDDYDDRPAAGKDKKRGGGTKRRSGCACLAAVVVLGGMVSGGGYVGYHYYENHFAPLPDYSGTGTGTVQVEVPDSSTLAQIGNILKQDGVVKSVDAFTKAATANPKGASIQGGIYNLHQQMSAAAAVTMMLDPAAQSALTVPEGWRASQIYDALDKRLGLAPGTTAGVARNTSLGLPSWDKDGSLEGFLFPAKYSAAKGGKPADILRQMVRQANAEYAKDDLQARAAKLGETPYQIVVIASLIQAEAQEPQDFGKVSRVIYNRLAQNMALGFDSTINYAKGRSTLDTTAADTQYQSPYNTYLHKGLPPGPIDNPGQQAIEAALNPTGGDWLYFVTVKPGDTRFTASAAVHQQNVEAFNKYQQEHGG